MKKTMPYAMLVVDPGKLTGMCLIQLDTGEQPQIVWSGEYEFDEACDHIEETCENYRDYLRVVCESFVITPMTAKNSSAPWSLEVIGVLKRYTYKFKCDGVVMQTPAKAKNFCPNERLKAVGMWHRGGDGHARDALRHGVTHLVECGWKPAALFTE